MSVFTPHGLGVFEAFAGARWWSRVCSVVTFAIDALMRPRAQLARRRLARA